MTRQLLGLGKGTWVASYIYMYMHHHLTFCLIVSEWNTVPVRKQVHATIFKFFLYVDINGLVSQPACSSMVAFTAKLPTNQLVLGYAHLIHNEPLRMGYPQQLHTLPINAHHTISCRVRPYTVSLWSHLSHTQNCSPSSAHPEHCCYLRYGQKCPQWEKQWIRLLQSLILSSAQASTGNEYDVHKTPAAHNTAILVKHNASKYLTNYTIL